MDSVKNSSSYNVSGSGGGSGKVSNSVALKKSSPKQGVSGGKSRKARLVVNSFNPWSVFRVSFLLSVALGVVYVVAAFVIWMVFSFFGLFDSLQTYLGITSSDSGSQLFGLFSFTQIMSFTVVVAVINVFLITVIMMVLALIYNVSASLVGGVKVVLTDE